jgi:hypothetical protein
MFLRYSSYARRPRRSWTFSAEGEDASRTRCVENAARRRRPNKRARTGRAGCFGGLIQSRWCRGLLRRRRCGVDGGHGSVRGRARTSKRVGRVKGCCTKQRQEALHVKAFSVVQRHVRGSHEARSYYYAPVKRVKPLVRDEKV